MSYTSYAPGKSRQNRNRKTNSPLTIIAAIIFICVIILLGYFIFGTDLSDDDKDDGGPDFDSIVYPEWIEQNFIVKNKYSRPGDKLEVVNGIVVHYIGNPGTTAKQNRNYFNNLAITHDTYASSHFIIDLDGSIIQCIPLDEIAYASNSRNGDTVSIECCHPDETGEFTDETYESLIKLVKWLMETFDISSDNVIRHYDVTGKICPKYYVENQDKWDEFIRNIRED